jgi:hypothetical protein
MLLPGESCVKVERVVQKLPKAGANASRFPGNLLFLHTISHNPPTTMEMKNQMPFDATGLDIASDC